MKIKRKPKTSPEPCRIFIGNINIHTTISEIWALFKGIRKPKTVVVHVTKSKVFAFAAFHTRGDAHNAISWVDGYWLNGSRLTVYFAQERL